MAVENTGHGAKIAGAATHAVLAIDLVAPQVGIPLRSDRRRGATSAVQPRASLTARAEARRPTDTLAIRAVSIWCAAPDILIAATMWPLASRIGAATHRTWSSFSSRSSQRGDTCSLERPGGTTPVVSQKEGRLA